MAQEDRGRETTLPAEVAHESDAAHIGKLIRRMRSGVYTLEELAAAAGVSSGLISQLERGQGNPSVVTLSKLAYALNVPISAFFYGPSARGDGVVRKNARRQLTFPSEGLTYELLTPNLQGVLALVRTRLRMGFANSERPFVHEGGEECTSVLSGTLEITVGGNLYAMSDGDSITFPSSISHWYHAVTDVELMTAMTPPFF